MYSLITLLSATLLTCVQTLDDDIVLKNSDPKKQARAILEPESANFIDPVNEFTFCFWISPEDDKQHFPFSYMASNGLKAAVGFNSTTMQLSIFGDLKVQNGFYDVKPYDWSHFCFEWGKSDGKATAFVNGEIVMTVENWRKNWTLPTQNPIIVIGQGWGSTSSLNGRITEFNYWSSRLSEELVSSLYNCEEMEEEGDIVGWDVAKWDFEDKASAQDTEYPCAQKDYEDEEEDLYDDDFEDDFNEDEDFFEGNAEEDYNEEDIENMEIAALQEEVEELEEELVENNFEKKKTGGMTNTFNFYNKKK